MGVPVLILAVLAAVAGLLYRTRLRDYVGGEDATLDDDMIRRIEDTGRVEIEDPTDLDEVRREEERFWSETWDQPEEP